MFARVYRLMGYFLSLGVLLPGISLPASLLRPSQYESMRKSEPIKKMGQSHTEPLGIYLEREAMYMGMSYCQGKAQSVIFYDKAGLRLMPMESARMS